MRVLLATVVLAGALYGTVAFVRADDVSLPFRRPTAADWATVHPRHHAAMRHCIALELDGYVRRQHDTTFVPGLNRLGASFRTCAEEIAPGWRERR